MTPEERLKVAELLASCTNPTSAKLIAKLYGLNPVELNDDTSIDQFLTTTTPVISGRATSELYQEYKVFCEENSLRAKYIVQFVNRIAAAHGLVVKSVKGKRTFVEDAATPTNVADFLRDTPERLINGMINFLVYEQYQKYCEQQGCQPISKIEFSKQICRLGGYRMTDKRMMGTKRRVYIK